MMEELQLTDFSVIKQDFVTFTTPETFLKEVSFALKHIERNGLLSKCSIESKRSAVLSVAECGLTLNPINQQAYLIPRYIRGQYECVLEPSYQGLMKLITDTGSATSIHSQVVYENDVFDVSYGTSMDIIHKPNILDRSKEDKIKAVYAVAVLADGSKQIEVMNVDDIKKIMEMSESYKAWIRDDKKPCVWIKHFGEMCRKTVIKRLCKYLPKTDQWNNLNKAIELDNSDYKFFVDGSRVDYLYALVNESQLPDTQRRELELEIMGGEITQDRFNEIQTMVDPSPGSKRSTEGSPTQIGKKMDNMGLHNNKTGVE